MANKGKKIVVITAEEAAKLKAKARARAIFKEIVGNSQYMSKRFENKKLKAERKRAKKEDHKIKRGEYL